MYALLSRIDNKAASTNVRLGKSGFGYSVQEFWLNVQISIRNVPNAWVIFIDHKFSILRAKKKERKRLN